MSPTTQDDLFPAGWLPAGMIHQLKKIPLVVALGPPVAESWITTLPLRFQTARAAVSWC